MLVILIINLIISILISCESINEYNFDILTIPATPSHLSNSTKVRRNAITLLIHTVHVKVISRIISMLDDKLLDNQDSDVIIFHNGYPHYTDMIEIRSKTNRFIDFVNIDNIFNRLPDFDGFDPYTTDPTWYKRGKWSYHNMIRFWFSDVFHLNVMKNVDFFLRIDDDSGFSQKFKSVFVTIKERHGIS